MSWTQTPDHEKGVRNGADYWDQRAATKWDQETHGAFGSEEAMTRAHNNLRRGLASVQLMHPQRILEIGCGYGASYPVIRDYFKTSLYFGMDCCTPYIEKAKRDFPKEDWFVGDVATWSPPLRADLVVAVSTVTSIEDVLQETIEKAFSEWLRPEGKMVIAEEPWVLIMEGPL